MTQSEELRNKLLQARDARWQLVTELDDGDGCLVMISSNMPGEHKHRADGIVSWAESELKKMIQIKTLKVIEDTAGRAVFMKTALHPAETKKAGVGLEELYPFCRLLDIDIYCGGKAFGRTEAGIGRRQCLICRQIAADCIRTGRHTYEESVRAAEKLISGFNSYI